MYSLLLSVDVLEVELRLCKDKSESGVKSN
jgi:hypothetical protein